LIGVEYLLATVFSQRRFEGSDTEVGREG
jgi:hypothetical protein